MSRGRSISREFELAALRQVLSGEQQTVQVLREHGLVKGLLLRWRTEVAERGYAAVGPPEATSTLGSKREAAELERFCGQLAPENAEPKDVLSALS